MTKLHDVHTHCFQKIKFDEDIFFINSLLFLDLPPEELHNVNLYFRLVGHFVRKVKNNLEILSDASLPELVSKKTLIYPNAVGNKWFGYWNGQGWYLVEIIDRFSKKRIRHCRVKYLPPPAGRNVSIFSEKWDGTFIRVD
jgi:hypothetical protein